MTHPNNNKNDAWYSYRTSNVVFEDTPRKELTLTLYAACKYTTTTTTPETDVFVKIDAVQRVFAQMDARHFPTKPLKTNGTIQTIVDVQDAVIPVFNIKWCLHLLRVYKHKDTAKIRTKLNRTVRYLKRTPPPLLRRRVVPAVLPVLSSSSSMVLPGPPPIPPTKRKRIAVTPYETHFEDEEEDARGESISRHFKTIALKEERFHLSTYLRDKIGINRLPQDQMQTLIRKIAVIQHRVNVPITFPGGLYSSRDIPLLHRAVIEFFE